MNIIRLDITNGLTNHKIGAGEYIKLLSAPAAANVTVKPHNDITAGIPLKVGYALIAKNDIAYSFVSCDAIAGEFIEIMQADNGDPYRLETTPSSVAVDQIGGYESLALAQLDKIINPYDIINDVAAGTVSTYTTILTKTLTCDKLEIEFFANGAPPLGNSCYIDVKIDGTALAYYHIYRASEGFIHHVPNSLVTLRNVKGKTLTVGGYHGSSSRFGVNVHEYTLKP